MIALLTINAAHLTLALKSKSGRIVDIPQMRNDKRWQQSIVRRLSRRHIDVDLVKSAVRWALFAGAYGRRIPKKLQQSDILRRTEYDLCLSLLRLSQRAPLSLRRMAERFVFDQLVSRSGNR